MKSSRLSGRHIVVTRAAAQAGELIGAIRAHGGSVVELPLLEIREPFDDGAQLQSSLDSLRPEDWLVITSPNGARRVVGRISPGRCRLAVIAAGTAAVFNQVGWQPDVVADVASSEGLLESLDTEESVGRVVIAQAEDGRDVLAAGLHERGVPVDVVVAYRNVTPEVSAVAIDRAREADTVVFASPSAVTRYVLAVGASPPDAVSIGVVTTSAAVDAGFAVTTANEPTVEGLVAALIDVPIG